MSGIPYVPLYPSDFLAGIGHLSNTELGIYFRLLLVYYRDAKPLPADVKRLGRLAIVNSPDEQSALEHILTEFFVQDEAPDGSRIWRHRRADRELDRARSYIEGKRSGAAKAREKLAAKRQDAKDVGSDQDQQAQRSGRPVTASAHGAPLISDETSDFVSELSSDRDSDPNPEPEPEPNSDPETNPELKSVEEAGLQRDFGSSAREERKSFDPRLTLKRTSPANRIDPEGEDDRTFSRKKKLAKLPQAQCEELFEKAWRLYPSRPGSNRMVALKAWRDRIREGCDPHVMIDGIERYAKYCEGTGTAAQFIKKPENFLGSGKDFECDWTVPPVSRSGQFGGIFKQSAIEQRNAETVRRILEKMEREDPEQARDAPQKVRAVGFAAAKELNLQRC